MLGDDHQQIHNLINLYFKLQDEGAFEELAELFAEAEFIFHGRDPIVYDAPRIAATKRDNVAFHGSPPSPCTRHAGQNVIITPRGEDAADAWSSVIVFQACEGFPLQPIIAASYDDSFVRQDGKWRFSRRAMKVDMVGDLSRHLLHPLREPKK